MKPHAPHAPQRAAAHLAGSSNLHSLDQNCRLEARQHAWPRTFSPAWVLVLAALFFVQTLSAFSPYELYLMSGKPMHVGLIAEIKPEKQQAFAESFKQCAEPPVQQPLKDTGITTVQAFTRNIEGKDFAVIFLTYAGGSNYLGAAAAFEAATASIDWKEATSPHPRAKSYGRHWLQMEWINFIRGLDVDRRPTSTLMIATSVIPEMEKQYRTLHQTTWPGVVDQAVRGNIRNLNIYLVELDDLLVEFLYLEYMGEDEAADDAANKADPINQRWWKLTDACQKPFSDVKEGIWTLMNPVGGASAGKDENSGSDRGPN
jgi:L-rhamnose mutarotase